MKFRFSRVDTLTTAAILLAVLAMGGCSAGTSIPFLRGSNADSEPVETFVRRVSFAERSDDRGYVVRLHATGPIPAFTEPEIDGNTIRVALLETGVAAGTQMDSPPGLVRSYRLDQKSRTAMLTLSLKSAASARAYRDADSHDLLLAIGPMGATNVLAAKNSVTSMPEASDEARRWVLDTVVIDAGHGGRDDGAVGHRGLKEKDLVLPVALKVGEYLREKLGLNVIYTRDDDTFIPLDERGHIANEAGAKLFVSIHANAAPDTRARGAETFFLGMHKTDAARNVMERENQVISLENDPSRYEEYDRNALIQQVLAQSAYMNHSQSLADIIQTEFEQRVGRRNRGVKQAGFYVLWSASMPAVLVELGFITNRTEAEFMASKDGQTYLASAIFRSIRAFKQDYEKALDVSARQTTGQPK